MEPKVWSQALRVAGTTFNLIDVSRLQSEFIYCEREPENPVDSHAIAVYNIGTKPRIKIGYVPKAISAQIDDQSLPCFGEIVWVSVPPQSPGVRIII